jgi:hypothetical protein
MINERDIKILREISGAVDKESADSVAQWNERAGRVVDMLHKELPDLSDDILAFIAQIVSSAAASVANVSLSNASQSLDLIFTSYSLAAARLLKIEATPADTTEPAKSDPGKSDNIGFYL